MNPKPNDYVKAFFRGGFIKEGIVVSWSDTKSVIKAPNSDNIFIIQKTIDDILLVEIIKTVDKPEATKPVFIDKPLEPQDKSLPKNPQERMQSLAELRIERMKLERERLKDHMNQQHPVHKEFQYGIPRKL